MVNRLTGTFIAIIFFCSIVAAQTKTVFPLTGIRYNAVGISAKNIVVRIDGATLLSNRLPANKEFELRLQNPAGFTEDKSKIIFPAAELSIVSFKGVVLSQNPNILKEYEGKGLQPAASKEIVSKLMISADLLKGEQACIVKLRYYDLKGKNQLFLEFPVSIARPGEVLQLSKLVNEIKIASPAQGKIVGFKLKNVDATVDTSIRVSPKMAYASLDMTGIEGGSISEFLSGKESFWVYDANLNEIKIPEKQLKQVGGAMENNVVNYLSKIPFRLKTETNKQYFIRFRWESVDKRKLIDIVVMK